MDKVSSSEILLRHFSSRQALLMLEEASGNTLEVKELRHLIQKDAILVENGLDRTSK